MISSDDLAKLRIRHIIFHDVPNNSKLTSSKPTFAEAVTEFSSSHARMLKDRLVRALGSGHAYDIEFTPKTSSPVPSEVINFTNKSHQIQYFIDMSQRLAQFLFEQQGGQMSPGLLCVIDVLSDARRGLAILKLEREQGADLNLSTVNGKRTFEMSVLENLVFTDGTRLFKSALFLKEGDDTYISAACDSQRHVTSSTDVARFWLRFLGCNVTEEPRVTTQKWYDTNIKFVNEYISDPIIKNDLYEHLCSELKSNKSRILPKTFIEDYIPDDIRVLYQSFLKEHGITMRGFDKDVSDIKSKLNRKSLYTRKGVTVTVPQDEEELVKIESKQIIVQDSLHSIGNK